MLMWGVLPLILQGVLRDLDPVTLTWFRFSFATVVLGIVLRSRAALPRLSGLGSRRLGLLLVATVFLAGNYIAYLLGLDRTNAPSAQVLIQAAPLLLALGAAPRQAVEGLLSLLQRHETNAELLQNVE